MYHHNLLKICLAIIIITFLKYVDIINMSKYSTPYLKLHNKIDRILSQIAHLEVLYG